MRTELFGRRAALLTLVTVMQKCDTLSCNADVVFGIQHGYMFMIVMILHVHVHEVIQLIYMHIYTYWRSD